MWFVHMLTHSHTPSEASVLERAETDQSFMLKQQRCVYLCSPLVFTSPLCCCCCSATSKVCLGAWLAPLGASLAKQPDCGHSALGLRSHKLLAVAGGFLPTHSSASFAWRFGCVCWSSACSWKISGCVQVSGGILKLDGGLPLT